MCLAVGRPRPPRRDCAMSTLASFAEALVTGRIEVVDLTAPLSAETPVIQLPAAVRPDGDVRARGAQPVRRPGAGLVLEQLPHRRAHRHALRRAQPLGHRPGRGRRRLRAGGSGSSRRPSSSTSPPRAAENPDFLLEVQHVEEWQATHGPLPDGGWLLYRTGWDARSASQQEFLNADDTGPHTPGISPACARWLAEEAPVHRPGRGDGRAPTPGPRTPSTRRSRATRRSWAAASTG